MEQRDYLKKQFDQLGRVLGKMLAILLELKTQGKVEETLAVYMESFIENVNLDIDELLLIEDADFIAELTRNKCFSNESLLTLAEIFLNIANTCELAMSPKLYLKSLVIYEYLQNIESVFSTDCGRLKR